MKRKLGFQIQFPMFYRPEHCGGNTSRSVTLL